MAKPENEEKPVVTPAVNTLRKSNPLFRFVRVAAKDFSDDSTVQFAASSEYPVQRRADEADEKLGIAKKGEKFLEVLSHKKEHVNLDRLNNHAALLDEHKDNRHLGSIEKAALSDDHILRVVAKFDGASKLSKTRNKQVRGGSRPHVSLGYAWTEYLGKESLADGRIVHRFAFEPQELSSVAVPADPTVGKGRAADECHCLRCGGLFERSLLNDDFTCDDCEAAETPDDDAEETGDGEEVRNAKGRVFRAKTKEGKEVRISHNELRNKLNGALDSDKRFKSKRENGDVVSDYYTHDIHLVSDSASEYQAIVSSPGWSRDGKMYAVDFQYDGSNVTLGEHTEVEPKTTFEAVDRSLPFDAKQFRSVDLNKNTTEQTTHKNSFMAETNIAPTEAEITAKLEPVLRTKIEGELKTRSGEAAGKITKRNAEIKARADAFVKEHGSNFVGKPGEVTTVGERIRSFEQEAITAGADMNDSEVRMEFTRKADEIIRASRPAKNPTEAANLDKSLASRCSLGNIIRSAMKAAEKTSGQTRCFMPVDGAEFEADRELRKVADEFPGGAASLADGVQLPWNMPSGVNRNTPVKRLGRDALAGDFASAGALIAPSYEFPTIELLRNLPALSRAGMTILSGLLGSPIVLPRHTAPTVGQSIAEGGALVQYDQTLDQIKLSAHRVGSSQKYSRLALLQSTPDFEAMVMADHMAVIALKIDYLGLNGQGAGDEPLGVLNQMVQSVTFAGSAANAFANAVKMETLVRAANVPDEISYITTSASRGQLKTVAKLLTGATTVVAAPVWGDNDEVNGRPAWDSQQVPGNVMLAGAFRHMVMAQWGGLAVVLDTISQANQDKYWLNVNTYIDFALRHIQAFCRSTDSVASLS